MRETAFAGMGLVQLPSQKQKATTQLNKIKKREVFIIAIIYSLLKLNSFFWELV
ncbi:hypothetical protein OSCI_350006 [Kamptonema sp. PCC 6506]|nr:hypothetical protein OSCI_350006 [Kamptonema sp. PCC 6506]